MYTYGGTTYSTNIGISYYNKRVKLEAYDNKLYLDDVLVEDNITSSEFQTDTYPSTIFAWGVDPSVSSYRFIGQLYKLVVKENGVVVKNYVPCKNSNNVYGLYETVNGTFLTSNTSTQLSGGGDYPIVLPEEYDTKVAPADNVVYRSLFELQANECPWIGMKATVGGNPYVYTANGWEIQYVLYDWLQNTSPAYINTGIKPKGEWNYELKVKITDSATLNSWYPVAGTTTPAPRDGIWFNKNARAEQTIRYYYQGTMEQLTSTFNLNVGDILIYTNKVYGKYLSIERITSNGTSNKSEKNTSTTVPSGNLNEWPIYLFSKSDAG